MELSCSLTTRVLQARLAPIPRLPILAVWSFSRSLSLSQARLLSARHLQHRTSGFGMFWTLLRDIIWVVCAHFCTCGVTAVFCATLISSLPETPRQHTDKKFPGCPPFIWDISLVELEMQILLLFSLRSHAPCATERQCLYPKAATQSCWRNGESSVQIRSLTILLFALIVLLRDV